MNNVDIEKALEIAIEIVNNAHAESKLHQLTNRLVRQEVEKKMDLEEGTLEDKLYKKRLNDAVATSVERLRAQKADSKVSGQKRKEGQKSEAGKPNSPTKKRKSVPAEAAETNKPRSTGSKKSGKSETNKAARKPDPEPVEEKRPDRESKASEEQSESDLPSKKPTSAKKEKFKSKDTVISDEEDANEQRPASVASTTPSKKKGKRAVLSESEGDAEGSSSPKKRKKSGAPSSKKTPSRVKNENGNGSTVHGKSKEDVTADDVEVKSDSELSSLIDDVPPKKGKGSRSKETTGDGKEKKSKKKKETKDVSADEEQIKKLKSLVVACGVRKVWSKELKDCETPSSQISHLRKLLTDLGMKGRFSLEQAKSIKAKRDLEKEMEDVQEFAQRHAGDRPKRSTVNPNPTVDISSDEENDEDAAEPSRRPKNAHRSIMAFLDDQSGSE